MVRDASSIAPPEDTWNAVLESGIVTVDAGDQGRYLNRDASLPPTHLLHQAVRGEPEMVSVDVERGFAVDARRRERADRVRAWAAARVEIVNAVTAFRSSCRFDPSVDTSLRAIVRGVERVSRDVAR